MAASAFNVQPHVAHAQELIGAIDRQNVAAPNRRIEVFTKFSLHPKISKAHKNGIDKSDCAQRVVRCGNQRRSFDSDGRRRSAGLVRAPQSNAAKLGVKIEKGNRNRGNRWIASDGLRDGAGCRRAAKGAILEMTVRTGVMMMRSHRRRCGCRTQFQQKWGATGRHKAGRDICAKKHADQKQASEKVASPGIKELFPHSL